MDDFENKLSKASCSSGILESESHRGGGSKLDSWAIYSERGIHRIPLLSPQWGKTFLPIRSLANILREQLDPWAGKLGTRFALAACVPTTDRTKLAFFFHLTKVRNY